MTTNHKPTSPLPWSADPEGELAVTIEDANGREVADVHGAADDPKAAATVDYLTHAANAYPELIEALRLIRLNRDGQIVHRASLERVDALLAKLGEL